MLVCVCVIVCDSVYMCVSVCKCDICVGRYKQAYVDFRQVLTLQASWDVAQQGATR